MPSETLADCLFPLLSSLSVRYSIEDEQHNTAVWKWEASVKKKNHMIFMSKIKKA